MGAIFAPTRFSLVRISIRDLVADGKSLVRNSGVGVGGSKYYSQKNFEEICANPCNHFKRKSARKFKEHLHIFGRACRINSGKSEVLVFFRTWSFSLHASYVLPVDDLGGACCREAMTPKSRGLRTSLFPNKFLQRPLSLGHRWPSTGVKKASP